MMDLKKKKKKKRWEVHREPEGMCLHLCKEWIEQSLREMLKKSDRKFSFFHFFSPSVDSVKVKGIDIIISVIVVRHFNDMVIICCYYYYYYLIYTDCV